MSKVLTGSEVSTEGKLNLHKSRINLQKAAKVLFLATGFGLSSFLLSSCTTTVSDPRITLGPGISSGIAISNIRIIKQNTEFPTCYISIKNTTSRVYPIQWKTTWLNVQGVECDEGATNMWQRIAIQPGEQRTVRNTAMSKDAADVRIYIREMQR